MNADVERPAAVRVIHRWVAQGVNQIENRILGIARSDKPRFVHNRLIEWFSWKLAASIVESLSPEEVRRILAENDRLVNSQKGSHATPSGRTGEP